MNQCWSCGSPPSAVPLILVKPFRIRLLVLSVSSTPTNQRGTATPTSRQMPLI
ncbi:hypothetical protein IF1G_08984 [Cordyceps javanica]|uniref:Uncharacterized protein n=1 Tax=Cordyceps javanica TaxID=43265 RepID=A0A545USN8_9HYPO|nr:hypothetical protein IF1G_08984 [Cordyceps javanica]